MSKFGDSARSVKIWAIAVVLLLIILFIVQNYQQQDIRFLFWRVRLSLSLALILVGATGLVLGFLWGARKARPRE